MPKRKIGNRTHRTLLVVLDVVKRGGWLTDEIQTTHQNGKPRQFRTTLPLPPTPIPHFVARNRMHGDEFQLWYQRLAGAGWYRAEERGAMLLRTRSEREF